MAILSNFRLYLEVSLYKKSKGLCNQIRKRFSVLFEKTMDDQCLTIFFHERLLLSGLVHPMQRTGVFYPMGTRKM